MKKRVLLWIAGLLFSASTLLAQDVPVGVVLAFKKGKFPQPRGARNVRQFIQVHRGEHSVKPVEVIDGITKMFPEQEKIELFARNNYIGWDNWGLEIPDHKIEIKTEQEKCWEEKVRQMKLDDE